MDDTSVDARSRLNDRFKLPSNLKSRLGHKEYEEQQQQYYDSGDSLERDTGADLGNFGVIFKAYSGGEKMAIPYLVSTIKVRVL